MASTNQTPTILQLPSDIWYQISTYIPNYELVRLYSVNRELFQISMSLRYRSISTLTHPKRLHMISQDSKLGHYVRSFELHNTSFPLNWYYTSSSRTKKSKSNPPWSIALVTKIPQRACNFLGHLTTATKDRRIVQRWRKLMGSLDQLMALNVTWIPPLDPPSSPHADSLLTPGWKCFGSNLRELSLSTTTKYLSQILTPSLHLERLETFSLIVLSSPDDHPTDNPENVMAATPFIQKHSETLQGLSLSSDTGFLMSVVQAIGHVPHLKKFKFSQPCQVWGNPAPTLHTFLFAHRDTITDVNFNFNFTDTRSLPGYTDWFCQESCLTQLPCLHSLELHLRAIPSSFHPIETRLCSYLTKHSCSLTELSIFELPLTFAQLQSLLDALVDPDDSKTSPLRILGIEVRVLAASVFDTLATKLPRLRDLRLGYYDIEHDSDAAGTLWTGWSFLDYFEKQMHLLSLDRWSLEVLDLSHRPGIMHYTRRIERCVAHSIPHVKFVNGRSRDDYTQENWKYLY